MSPISSNLLMLAGYALVYKMLLHVRFLQRLFYCQFMCLCSQTCVHCIVMYFPTLQNSPIRQCLLNMSFCSVRYTSVDPIYALKQQSFNLLLIPDQLKASWLIILLRLQLALREPLWVFRVDIKFKDLISTLLILLTCKVNLTL